MSGHSKWSQIKRQKGAADIKRGQTFTKIANAITIAVREGGGVTDPNQNFRLRLIIDRAKTVNMPKENIERAISRALSKKESGDLEEITYEGFGPRGISVMIEAATDNRLRTQAEIKHIFEKAGGSLGQPGSVAYQFKKMGMVVVKKDKMSFDDVFQKALESGAEDLQDVNDEVFIYTDPVNLTKVKDALLRSGLEVVKAELVQKPVATISVEDSEQLQKIHFFIENLEELEDVQKVFTNVKT